MAIEMEKKYRLTPEQRDYIIEGLKEYGAEFVGTASEVNIIYGGHDLRSRRAALRVRKTDERTMMTFKQRMEDELGVKRQIEYETEVSNAEETEKIIESLGFWPGLIYEKHRKTWRIKNTEVVIDELPFGLFMEIEGKFSDIALVEMMLEAEDFEVEHETYPMLTERLGKLNGKVIEARFEK